jgi:TonB family protein
MISPILVVVGHLALSAFGTPQAAAQPPTIGEQAKTAPLPLPEGVFRPGGAVTLPEIVKEVRPQYTAESMRAKIQGVIEVEAVVQTDGTVGMVRVVRSLDKEHGLDEQAVKAVKQWRFRPGKKDGVAVPVLVSIDLTFTLRDKRE